MLASICRRGIAALGVRCAVARRQDGQALVEYALILSLVSIAAFVALKTTGTSIGTLLQAVADDL